MQIFLPINFISWIKHVICNNRFITLMKIFGQFWHLCKYVCASSQKFKTHGVSWTFCAVVLLCVLNRLDAGKIHEIPHIHCDPKIPLPAPHRHIHSLFLWVHEQAHSRAANHQRWNCCKGVLSKFRTLRNIRIKFNAMNFLNEWIEWKRSGETKGYYVLAEKKTRAKTTKTETTTTTTPNNREKSMWGIYYMHVKYCGL